MTNSINTLQKKGRSAKRSRIASDTILSGIVEFDKYTITSQMEWRLEIGYYVYPGSTCKQCYSTQKDLNYNTTYFASPQ